MAVVCYMLPPDKCGTHAATVNTTCPCKSNLHFVSQIGGVCHALHLCLFANPAFVTYISQYRLETLHMYSIGSTGLAIISAQVGSWWTGSFREASQPGEMLPRT
ncbi:hypothetical protein ABBQ32_007616 [Trebouxia sp. C0010 RCD-2024]